MSDTDKLFSLLSDLETKVRRVRTPKGVEKFGEGIGEIITSKPGVRKLKEGAKDVIIPRGKVSISKTDRSRRERATRLARSKTNTHYITSNMDRRRNRTSDGARILKQYSLSSDIKKILEKGKVPTGKINEISPDDAKVFRDSIASIKNGSNPYHASVYVYDEDEYKKMRLFMYEDGRSGFALKDGEIVSVFSHSDDEETKGVAHNLLLLATELGGERLDCFDTELPKIYAVHGFEAVARVPFDPKEKPKGWLRDDYAKYNDGKPDVVFMAYNKNFHGKYKNDDGETVSTYQEGIDMTIKASKNETKSLLVEESDNGVVEIDITDLLTSVEIDELFMATESEDWSEVDRLTGIIEADESKGLEAVLGIEIKKGGTDKNRGNAETLRHYWTVGKGGQKIQWRTPGDWTRCVALLSEHLGVRAKGYCALRHKEMDGFYPGDKRNKDDKPNVNGKKSLEQVYSEADSNISTKLFGDDMSKKATFNPDEVEIPGMEYKSFGVKGLTVVDEDQGIVETLISVTGIKDEVNDIIEPGAFTKTLAKRLPKGVWSHNWNEPVSKTLDVKELLPGDPGLPKFQANGQPWNPSAGAVYIKTLFNLGTQRGRDAFTDVKFFGEEQEWSLGYNVPQHGATIEQKTGIRRIHTLDFFEYSPVLFGAMPEARTLSVKSAQNTMKQLKMSGAASSWVQNSNNNADLEDEDNIDLKTRVYTGEQIKLIAEGIVALQNILDSIGEPDGDDENDISGDLNDIDDPNDDDGDVEDLGYDTLTEVLDDLLTADNTSIPADVLNEMSQIAQDFDNAVSAVNMDELDVAGTKMLDMIQTNLENADENTTTALETIAKAIAEFIENLTSVDDSQDNVPPSPKPPLVESVEGKDGDNEQIVGKTVAELSTEVKSFFDSMRG